MKTRAKLISARFGIHPGADGSGTQIEISLPKSVQIASQTNPVQDAQKDIFE
jgi:hypothetical protein